MCHKNSLVNVTQIGDVLLGNVGHLGQSIEAHIGSSLVGKTTLAEIQGVDIGGNSVVTTTMDSQGQLGPALGIRLTGHQGLLQGGNGQQFVGGHLLGQHLGGIHAPEGGHGGGGELIVDSSPHRAGVVARVLLGRGRDLVLVPKAIRLLQLLEL